MKTHYIPAFTLEQFKDGGGLYQLLKQDATCRRKNHDNCGFVRGLYTPELETGLLKDIDDNVSRLCRKWIWGRRAGDVITFRPWQKQRIAEWIGLATMRTPRRLYHFKRYTEHARNNPQMALDILDQGGDRALLIMKASNPAAYDDLVQVIGKRETDDLLVLNAKQAVLEGKMNYLPDPHQNFNQFINEERMKAYARRLLRKQWTWFYSPYGFIISDNPVAVWHPVRNNWQEDYGIGRKGTEIVIPFSRHLCLRLRSRQIRTDKVLYCNRETTRRYNHWQLLGTYEKLFGPSARIMQLAVAMRKRVIGTARPRNAVPGVSEQSAVTDV